MAHGQQDRPVPARAARAWPALVGLALVALVVLGGLGFVAFHWFASQGTQLFAGELEEGDCVQEPSTGGLEIYPLVSCTDPHHGEVIEVVPVEGRAFPGERALGELAERACGAAMDRLDPPTPITLHSIRPTAAVWDLGDRRIVCLAVAAGGPLSSPLGVAAPPAS